MAQQISGTLEFVSHDKKEGIDAQINQWLKANPDVSVVDVKYRVTVFQSEGQNNLVRFALVLFSGEPKTKKEQSASSMVISLRKDLKLNPTEGDD